MIRALALLAALLIASAGHAQTPRDLSSPAMLDGRHLIITVAISTEGEARRRMASLAARHPVEPITVWPLQSIALHCLVVRVSDGASVRAAIRALGAEPGVRTVQPVNSFRTSDVQYPDELFPKQRALSAMNVARAHEVATGARVRVAIVDTGIDAGHPDLSRRVSLSRDFVNDGRDAASPERHGTAVAGVVAADGRNGRGMVGVAPDARLLALRACWEEGRQGRCASFSLARALNFAILRGPDVINLSLGGPDDPLLRDLIERAIARGIIVVSAGGGSFPANVPGVIAANRSGGRVAAPGTDVITTLPGGRYGFRSGTSISAGHVSGIVALMRQSQPSAAASQIRAGLAAARRSVVDACLAVAAVRRRGEDQCGS